MLNKQKKIILIHPPALKEKLYSHLKDAGSDLPPLGICYLAAKLRQHNYKVKLLDCQAEKLNINTAVKRVAEFKPHYIGISSYTPVFSTTNILAENLKAQLPHVPIIIGGGHITSLPNETMEKFSAFDIGVLQEGEETLINLLHALENNLPLKNVKGIIYRQKNNGEQKVVKTAPQPFIKNLDSLPRPAWELLPYIPKYYSPPADSINRFPSASLITSRGCSGKCDFCNLTLFGNVVRSHSVDYVMMMINDLITRFNIKEIFFQDDTIFIHRNNLRELCERLIYGRYDLSWNCYGRVDYIKDNDELLPLMKKAGCWQIAYGIETASQQILDNYQKKTTVKQIKRAVWQTHKAGIKVKGLFMLGNFLETKKTIEDTIKFIKSLPLSDFHMTYFTPFPGSKSYTLAKNYGKFNAQWENLDMFTVSFVPQGLTKKQLEYYFKKNYLIFYFRPKIIFYYLTKFKNLNFTKKIIFSGISFLKYLLKRQ